MGAAAALSFSIRIATTQKFLYGSAGVQPVDESRRSAQAELGWKSTWNDGALISDVAVYRLNQRNMIAADQSTPLNNFDFTVAGSAPSQGLEASLTGAVSDRLTVAASYAFTDAKYQDNPVYGGRTVPNVARHTVSLWGQYAWSAQWKTGAALYLQTHRFADEANATVLPGYGRLTWCKAGRNVWVAGNRSNGSSHCATCSTSSTTSQATCM